MSKDSVKQMFFRMEKESEFKKKYAELMRAQLMESETAMADKLIELGKTSGFSFSKDDLMAARAELADTMNSNSELSEGDLARVAGGDTQGKVRFGVSSLYSLGVVCLGWALHSAVFELENPGSCPGNLSLSETCTAKKR